MSGPRAWILLALAATLGAVELRPSVTAEIPWGSSDRYVPVLVRVRTPVEGRFAFAARLGQHHATIEADLAAGTARTLTLLLPGVDDPNPDAEVRWTGPGGSEGTVGARCLARQWRALAIVDRDEVIPLKRFALPEDPPSHVQFRGGLVERVPLESLPQRWQGYPARMVLLFSAADDRRLDDERRAAIATWAAAGGAVAVAEPAQAAAWRALGVEPLPLDGADGGAALRARIEAANALETPPDLRPVPGTERVPATGFALVAVLFALVVGPLNLWWARRRGNRHLLLLTTPVLSLATCVSLLAVNLLIEGIALRRSALQVTLLDQARARAVAWTRATYYGGFAVNDVALDAEACVRPFTLDRYDSASYGYAYGSRYRDRAAEELTIDWRGGQHLAGWIPARTNRQLLFTVPRPERARLTVERVGDGWQATNGLGVGIRELAWRDGDGREHVATGIAFGASATLVPARPRPEEPVADDDHPRLELDSSGERALHLAKHVHAFHAELEAPFGALAGPPARDATPPRCVVVGIATPGGAAP